MHPGLSTKRRFTAKPGHAAQTKTAAEGATFDTFVAGQVFLGLATPIAGLFPAF